MYAIIMSQGKFTHKDGLKFSYEERGFQFGDGVYEVIRIYKGEYYLLDEHIARLYRSLEAIHIQIKHTPEELKALLLQLLMKNHMKKDGFVYLQVTRGSAVRNHIFPENTAPNIFAYIEDRARNVDAIENGVRTILLPDERWDNCYIKSLNLLPNVLAKQTAYEQGCYEAILHDDQKVTECGSSNVFFVKDGKIYTHPTTKRILAGCVRMAVKQFAKNLKIPFIEEAFTVDDIFEADEMFLTSSLSEVIPIIEVEGKQIADGKPGEIARQLQLAYEKDANIQLEIAK